MTYSALSEKLEQIADRMRISHWLERGNDQCTDADHIQDAADLLAPASIDPVREPSYLG